VKSWTLYKPETLSHSASAYQISSESEHSAAESWRHILFKMAATASQFYFRFRFLWFRLSEKVEIYTCIPNFGEISQCTAEILLLPVSENKRLPCWHFTSGSDFYVCVSIGMWFCISLPNFIQIGPSSTQLWRHMNFSRWRPRLRNSTSAFGFRDFAYLGRSKSTCIPNFDEISQSTAEI